jgi:hypothetical protein
MPANERYCAQLIQCFDQFANWSYISDETKAQLVRFLAVNARDDHEAHAAIQDLLGDTARASSTATNRVPTTGELKVWLESQRNGEAYQQAETTSKGGCGKVFEAWRYIDGDGHWQQSRCENGVVRRTVLKRVQGRLDEDGKELQQAYDYSGFCKCHPQGGWL